MEDLKELRKRKELQKRKEREKYYQGKSEENYRTSLFITSICIASFCAIALCYSIYLLTQYITK
jgi:hypothetical protein